ncbi:MAG TPA: molybdenum cofactor biosynthesis protein MoaE [Rhizomicrobium sp.]|jgi:molybdopterin synthase catalytic subunit|nr:molybdenum cofactor biosynthesis protein MoaE [Rhizomicrobium sp.]
MNVRLTNTALDVGAELAAFVDGRTDAGALVNFVGYCRDATAGQPVDALFIDHYPNFSERQIAAIAEGICRRFEILDLRIVHRVGRIEPGEAIVLVAALSVHRGPAFDGVRMLMDYLKIDAPFWKQESGPDGARWIEPSAEDLARRTEVA